MRDPASKKDSRSRARQVSRQELLRTSGHIVANVIDRHQHHDGPTQSIHRLNARRRYRLSGNRGRSHDFAILFFMPTSDCRFLKQPPPVGANSATLYQACFTPVVAKYSHPNRCHRPYGRLLGMYGPPLRRKRKVRVSQVGLRKCIRPLLEWITPGQDGMRCALFPIRVG